MQIPVIKKLVREHDLPVLEKAEEAIVNGEEPDIEVQGEDEGEQLTHAFAAKWIRQKMDKEDLKFNKALRAYSQKVRKSID